MDESKKSLRERCRRWIEHDGDGAEVHLIINERLVDDLQAFVMAEVTRRAAPEFESSPALALFFASIEDRDGFVADWESAHPGSRTIKVDP